MTEGFILGLSTGVVCVAYCGPVLIPYLMAESGGIKKSLFFVALFLSGRLAAYIATAFLAGLIGQSILKQSDSRAIFMSISYIFLATLMIVYGFYRFREICLGTAAKCLARPGSGKISKIMVPITGGFLSGINICPPFLLAITGAIDTGSIAKSIFFFLAFFLGTSVYFIPMPFIGMFRKQQAIRIIGKFAAIIAGIIYFYKGLLLFISETTLK